MRKVGIILVGVAAAQILSVFFLAKVLWNGPIALRLAFIGMLSACIVMAVLCFQFGDESPYADAGWLKAGGQPRLWDLSAFPLGVHYTELPPEAVSTLVDVTRRINLLVGLDLFSYPVPTTTADAKPGVVTVISDEGVDPNHASTVFAPEFPPTRAALVTIPVVRQRTHMQAILFHEMGHVLGLAHDDSRNSIMNARLNLRPVTYTTADIALLRQAYGSESSRMALATKAKA